MHPCFQIVSPDKYEVKATIPEAAIILSSFTEPKMQVTITLTSPIIREEGGPEGGWKHTSALCTLSLPSETGFIVDNLKSTFLLAR